MVKYVKLTKGWIADHALTKTGALNNSVRHRSWWINRGWGDLVADFDFDVDNMTRALYDVYHSGEGGLCKACGKPTAFINFKDGYRTYCSPVCVTTHTERNEKIAVAAERGASQRMASVRAKRGSYGFEDPLLRESATNRRRVLYAPGSDAAVAADLKRTSTCMDRYGAPSPMHLPEHQAACRASKLAKYGQHVPRRGASIASRPEAELRSWLEQSTGLEFPSTFGVLPNGLELDGFNQDRRIAFEYCGLYWHSSAHKRAFYHRHKLRECRYQGIRLFTVFEDEWLERRPQVQSFLLAALGVYQETIGARQCSLRLHDGSVPKDVTEFVRDHHIQGASQGSTRAVSLHHGGRMVGAVTFRRHHRDGCRWTLSRLVFAPGVKVPGGSARMIAAARAAWFTATGFDTWSDSRWTEGAAYQSLGMVEQQDLAPDYWYVKGQKRFSKQAFQKKAIGCPSDMSEGEWMESNGFLRIYDCGKKRWHMPPLVMRRFVSAQQQLRPSVHCTHLRGPGSPRPPSRSNELRTALILAPSRQHMA